MAFHKLLDVFILCYIKFTSISAAIVLLTIIFRGGR